MDNAERYQFCKQYGFPKYNSGAETPYGNVVPFWHIRVNDVLFRADTIDAVIDKAINELRLHQN